VSILFVDMPNIYRRFVVLTMGIDERGR